MRLTNRMITDSTVENMNKNLDKLYNLQQQSALGKKYLRPSDNPAATTQSMDMNSTLRQIGVYQDTMASTKSWMDTTDFALNQLATTFSKAQTALMQGMNDTNGADQRKVLGTQLDGIIKDMLDITNTQDNGRYIFSGLKTDVKPFELKPQSLPVTDLWINVQAKMDMPPVITVNGGVTQADITVNGVNTQASLLNPATPGIYTLDATTTPASPLPGISIVVDTNGTSPSYTVNGKAVAIDKTNPNYPGITDNVDITPAPLNPAYKTDTVVYNGDLNTIQRYIAPNEQMNVSINGTAFGMTTPPNSDIFSYLIRARDALNNADYLTPHTLTAGTPPAVPYTPLINPATSASTQAAAESPDRSILQDVYTKLQNAFSNITQQIAYNGAREKQLSNGIDRMDKAALEMKSLISQNEDVNLADAISQVQNQTTVYQAVINISAKTNSTMTLFDKI